MFSLAMSAGGEDELHFREGSRKIRDISGIQGDAGRALVLSQTKTQNKDVNPPIPGSKKHHVGMGGTVWPLNNLFRGCHSWL